MKFVAQEPFEKHANSGPIAPLYLIGSPDSYERRKMTEKLYVTLAERLGDIEKLSFSVQKDSVEKIIEALNTKSFFSTVLVGWLDEVEKLKAEDAKTLRNYFLKPSTFSCLILSGSSLKQLEDIVGAAILDLNQEKPWDKKERLRRWLVSEAIKEKKKIQPRVVDEVIAHISDLALLQQEFAKWICAVGARDEITLNDVQSLSSFSSNKSFWQLCDELIWEGKAVRGDTVEDPALLFPLLGQLRSQLEIGLKLSTLLERKVSLEESKKYFPQLKPNTFQKCLEGARKRSPAHFKNGLLHLFELELGLKSGVGTPALLFDLFVAKLFS